MNGTNSKPAYHHFEIPPVKVELPMFGASLSMLPQTVDAWYVTLPGVDFAEYVIRSPLPSFIASMAGDLSSLWSSLSEYDVVLMRGVPGSGKSSFVDKLCRTHDSYDRPDTVVASADDYFVDVLGKYNFDARQLSAAHGYAQATFRKALGARRVIVDNTNVRLGDLQQYLSLIATYAKHSALVSTVVVAVVTVLPPKGMSLDVYADGCAARNSHGVPRHVISRMIEELASQYPDAESGDPDLTTFNRMAAVLSGPDKAEKA